MPRSGCSILHRVNPNRKKKKKKLLKFVQINRPPQTHFYRELFENQKVPRISIPVTDFILKYYINWLNFITRL